MKQNYVYPKSKKNQSTMDNQFDRQNTTLRDRWGLSTCVYFESRVACDVCRSKNCI